MIIQMSRLLSAFQLDVLGRFKDHLTIILEYKMFKTSELHYAASGCIETLDGGAILGGRVTSDAVTWPVVEMVSAIYAYVSIDLGFPAIFVLVIKRCNR